MNRGRELGGRGPCTYSRDPLSGVMVQLGLLGLQVLPEGLLQCRTQQWKRSASTNTQRQRGWEEERKRRERKKRERERERVEGEEGGEAQITSRHCYSPAQGQQQREACCPVSCTVSLPPASSLGEEREREGATSAIPSLLIPTHTHIPTHSHTQ